MVLLNVSAKPAASHKFLNAKYIHFIQQYQQRRVLSFVRTSFAFTKTEVYTQQFAHVCKYAKHTRIVPTFSSMNYKIQHKSFRRTSMDISKRK